MRNLIVLVILLSTLSGCGRLVSIPTCYVAKVKTTKGFVGEVRQPSTFRMPPNWFGLTPSTLVMIEASDNEKTESFKLWMPQNQLNLEFDLVATIAVATDEARRDMMFERLPSSSISSGLEVVSFDAAYSTYGQQTIRTVTRDTVANRSITNVLENLDEVSQEVFAALNRQLKDTPLEVIYCGFGKVDPPDVLVNAQVEARKREIQNEETEAQKEIDLIKADAKYQVGLKQQQVELIEAETQVLVDQQLAEAVSPAFVAQRSLRVLKALANSSNKVFVLPADALENPAMLLGLASDDLKFLEEQGKDARQKALEKARAVAEALRAAAESSEEDPAQPQEQQKEGEQQ